jgi:hypothetical protein
MAIDDDDENGPLAENPGRKRRGRPRGPKPDAGRLLRIHFNQGTKNKTPHYDHDRAQDVEIEEAAPLLPAAPPGSASSNEMLVDQDDGADDADAQPGSFSGLCCGVAGGATTTAHRQRRAERQHDEAARQEASWVSGKYKAMGARLMKVGLLSPFLMSTMAGT